MRKYKWLWPQFGLANHLVLISWFIPRISWLIVKSNHLRATSHTRLRARDHHTSSTLLGGKGRAGSTSLHTTLAGPTKYVNARWM